LLPHAQLFAGFIRVMMLANIWRHSTW